MVVLILLKFDSQISARFVCLFLLFLFILFVLISISLILILEFDISFQVLQLKIDSFVYLLILFLFQLKEQNLFFFIIWLFCCYKIVRLFTFVILIKVSVKPHTPNTFHFLFYNYIPLSIFLFEKKTFFWLFILAICPFLVFRNYEKKTFCIWCVQINL